MAQTVKGITVEIGGETKKLSAALKSLNKETKALQTELKGVETLLKFDPKNVTLIKQKQDLLAASIASTTEKLASLKDAQAEADAAMQAGEEVNQKEYRNLQREIASTEAKMTSLIAKQREFSGVASVQLQAVGEEMKKLGTKLGDLGKSLLPVTVAIAAIGAASLKASIDFESSFAGVRKTVNATAAEFDALAASARASALTKPVDVNDINYIMELGGQLNVAKENLAEFASVIADLDVSTNMNLEDASLQLSQFMNICGTAQTDIDRLGATLVGLGNNSATTESAIMEMAMRIAGSGHQIGLTEAQIMGLSASLSSVGIEAQMGGSAISRTMSEIDVAVAKNGDDLAAWAQAAGMSAQEFKVAWERDAAGALTTLFAGMQQAVEEGGNVNLILQELGITELRQSDTLKRLTSAAQLMNSTMDIANVSWAENTALTNEAAQRYATTESRLNMLKNQVVDIGISIGNGLKGALLAMMDALGPVLDGISSLAHAFEEADPVVQSIIIGMGGFAASIAPVLIVTGKLSKLVGEVATQIGKASAQMVAGAAATATDTAATTANTAATSANTAATNLSILRSAIKEAVAARLAARTAAGTLATVADTAATSANTAATNASGIASAGAAIKTVALSVATRAKTIAVTAATVAQLGWNAAMSSNPVGAVVLAVSALVGVVGALTVAIATNSQATERLAASSQKQKERVDELSRSYEEAVAQAGEHSDAADAARYALDEQRASFEATRETLDEFVERVDAAVASHDELMESTRASGEEASTQAGKMLYLADQIAILADAEERSATDKQQLAVMTQTLNEQVEGLGLTYDAQTDSLNMTAEAISAVVNAQADQVRSQAALDTYSALLSEQVTLELQLQEAHENLAEQSSVVVDEYGYMGDESVILTTNTKELEGAVTKTQDALAQNAATQKKALELAAKYTTKQSVLARATQEVASHTLSAQQASEKYSDAVEGGITAEEIDAQLKHEAALAAEELATATNQTAEAIKSYCEEHPALQASLQASGLTAEQFADILVAQGTDFDTAASQIESYSARAASGFSRVSDSSKNTLDSLYETLAFNLSATQNWSNNLESVFGRTGVSFSTEFVNAVRAGGVDEYGTVIAQMVQLSDEELQKISDSYATNGQAGVQSYLAEQRLLVPGIHEALGQTEQAVSTELEAGTSAASTAATNTAVSYATSLSAKEPDVELAAGKLVGATTRPLYGIDAATIGSDMSTDFGEGVGSAQGIVETNAATIAQCCNRWSVFADQSHAWGYDAAKNFASGMTSALSNVIEAAETVADAVRERIHFSVPDTGPLADADEYGPDFVSLFASGIRSRISEVSAAATQVAQAANDAMRVQMDGAFAPQNPLVMRRNIEDTHTRSLQSQNVTDSSAASVISLLEQYLPALLESSARSIYLDGKTLVGSTVGYMDEQLGNIYRNKKRGGQ